MNSRNRFKTRTALKQIRSRSANPPDRSYRYYSENFPRIVNYRPTLSFSSQYDITHKPIFSTKLTERTATENSSIRLTCNILGDSNVKWLKDNRELLQSSRHRSIYSDGLAMLEIFSARPDDAAKYTCVAKNQFGTNSCSSRLRVFPDSDLTPMPPIFTRPIKGKALLLLFYLKKKKFKMKMIIGKNK